MPNAAVIAAALTDHSSRSKALWIGGVDVIASPTHTYGIDPTSVRVVEAGPGQVSSLSAVLVDPTQQIALSPGMIVQFWDLVLDLPIFAGFIQGYTAESYGLTPSYAVECVGIEILLDWMYVPTFTIPIGTGYDNAVQMVASAAVGIGVGLRWATDTSGAGLSSVAFPVGSGLSNFPTASVCTIPGGSLRQALQFLGAFFFADSIAQGTPLFALQWQATIDFYGGLRWYNTQLAVGANGRLDAGLTTLRSDGANKPSATRYGVNTSASPRAVYVIGTGGGTGAVGDGSGMPGQTVQVNDANSVSVNARTGIAAQYLGSPLSVLTGTVVAEGSVTMGTFAAQKRAGDFLDLLDSQVGLSALVRFPTQRITKTFANSGEETWTIDFGGEIPSGVNLMRRLTRSTLS
jgi:hypothetical protein